MSLYTPNVTPDIVFAVAERLKERYNTPDLGNLKDPLDELIFILMSTMTTSKVHVQTFAALKQKFPEWSEILNQPVEQLIDVIKQAGLSKQKGNRIYKILQRIAEDHGNVGLGFLRYMEPSEAERYLLNLPGVGKKVARCVMIYSLGMDAFPVDAHVYRVAKRLGWIPETLSWNRAHDILQAIVPKGIGHDLHVNIVAHGRKVCLAVAEPRCSECIIQEYCRYYREHHTQG